MVPTDRVGVTTVETGVVGRARVIVGLGVGTVRVGDASVGTTAAGGALARGWPGQAITRAVLAAIASTVAPPRIASVRFRRRRPSFSAARIASPRSTRNGGSCFVNRWNSAVSSRPAVSSFIDGP